MSSCPKFNKEPGGFTYDGGVAWLNAEEAGEREAAIQRICDAARVRRQTRHMGLMLALPIVAALALIFAAGLELLK